MASGFEITIDEQTYADLQRDLGGAPAKINSAIVGAINKAVAQGKTIVVDKLYALLTAKRGRILKHITTKKAAAADKVGLISIKTRPISLASFKIKDTTKRGHRTTGQGVIAQIYRGGESRTYPHAFTGLGLGAAGKGNKLVFERIVGPKHRVTNPHYPGNKNRMKQSLHTVTGVSLRGVADAHPEILSEAKSKVQSILRAQVLSQIDRILKRRRADRPLAQAA